ncbi:hypothetical protein HYPSUDRAFT_215290 [Hypholoma sublateritium FD-334 SS-4]|uniref:Origin recognition complex subunit 6 n=1 Tax=Hypholoma sublateritium (strain FD-334 SS-4) TaxID=945553 RepID=A0A0D2L7V6_HYPSF|nr:hypothetical protein HYPSUDRAFT_215290 [Hypholoma sublateritium FD-334 SS-4]
MSKNHHLIESFIVSQEVKDLAHELNRSATTIMTEGSGRNVRQFAAGLPAACMLLASENLNTGEVTRKSAQVASCLKPKEFQRVYDALKSAIEEAEKSTCITYHELHQLYKVEHLEEMFAPYITQATDELLLHSNQSEQTALFRCSVFFWSFTQHKLKSLPSTEMFASSHSIPLKTFVALLDLLNTHSQNLMREIRANKKVLSPIKQVGTPSAAKTSALVTSKTDVLQESPSRRSSRTNIIAAAIAKAPLRQSPRKQLFEGSPTKVVQLPRLVLPGKKRVLRELPSKDSPKKRVAVGAQIDHEMEVDEVMPGTPTKKRKMDSFPKHVSTSSRTPDVSPIKKNAPGISPSLLTPLPQIAPPARVEVVDTPPNPFLDDSLDSDESDNDEPASVHRFRPVYLEYKQWYTRDPRLTRIWKKANNLTNAVNT